MDDIKEKIAFLFIALLILFILIALFQQDVKRKKWLHDHCNIIGKMSDDIGIGVSSNGNAVTTFIPGKTGYKCEDGFEYWE